MIADYTVGHREGSAVAVATREVLRGGDKAVDAVLEAVKGEAAGRKTNTTWHFFGNPEIAILSPTTAKAVWMRENEVYYLETYERIGGNWKMKTLRLVRVVPGNPADINKMVFVAPPKNASK